MELLANHKTEYLLDASLEYLHSESLEWLKEIEFWKDEMIFFNKLLHKEGVTESLPNKELSAIEMDLIAITKGKLDDVSIEIQNHERSLVAFMKTTLAPQEDKYRHDHRRLLYTLIDLHNVIRNFKKNVFAFVCKYQPSNCISLYEQGNRL